MSKRWKGEVPERVNKRFDERGSPAHEAYKAKMRAWYNKNKEEQREKARERVSRKRLRNQQWLVNYMHNVGCEDCGEGDPRKLTFDHLNPDDKHANVADLTSRGSKLEHLIAEVAKCGVVCHNCHMLRTFEALGGTFRDRLKPMTDEEFEKFREELGV